MMIRRSSDGTTLQHESDQCATCQRWIESGYCTYSCGRSPLYELAPGQSVTLRWLGTYFVPRAIPESCVDESSAGDHYLSCLQEAKARPGNYQIDVIASAAFACTSVAPVMCQITKPDGGYVVSSVYGSGEMYAATAMVRVPDQNRVEVTFRE